MSSWVAAAALVGGAACSRDNPAYESGAMVDSGGAGGTAGESGTGIGPGETGAGSLGQEGTGSSGASTEPDPTDDPQAEYCDGDLYAINLQGQLHIIDVETSAAIPMLVDPDLGSEAIATQPGEGAIFISPSIDSSLVYRVNPVTFQIDPVAFDAAVVSGSEIARAGFDPGGTLWLGTDATSQFFQIDLVSGLNTAHTADGTGADGDLAFVEPSSMLIVGNDGYAYQMASNPPGLPQAMLIDNLPQGEVLTGLAHDRSDRLWASNRQGLLYPVERTTDRVGLPVINVGAPLQLDIGIGDLAPVVTLPGGC